jgi:allantoinase
VITGKVVTADAMLDHGYVAIRGETIAAIGEGALPPAVETIDHGGKFILPGLVDGHMHTSSSTGWPGIESATRCAAAGGVTTCCDMPYDVPAPVTDAAILADKIGWVERTAHVDMALYGTIPKTGGIDAIPGLAAAGVSAFKLSTYEYDAVRFPRIDHPTMLAAFREIAKTGLPVAIHNEDQELVEALTAEARAAGRCSRSCIAAPARRWQKPWRTWISSRWRWKPAPTFISRIPPSHAAFCSPKRFAAWVRRPQAKPASSIYA